MARPSHGNVVHQGLRRQNGNLWLWRREPSTNPRPQRLQAINNTFVNERATGNYSDMHNTVLLKAWNNICAGPGDLGWRGVALRCGYREQPRSPPTSPACSSPDPFTYDYHIPVGSPAQSGGMAGGARSQRPSVVGLVRVRASDVDSILRCQHALLDVWPRALQHHRIHGESAFHPAHPDPATDVLNISFLQGQVPERIQVVDMKGRGGSTNH
ncbi:MAG: hypothetical protein R2810_04965 [Flavobacteriales bacterium]